MPGIGQPSRIEYHGSPLGSLAPRVMLSDWPAIAGYCTADAWPPPLVLPPVAVVLVVLPEAELTGIQALPITVLFTSLEHPCRRVMALRTATITANFATSLLFMVFLAFVETAVIVAASTPGWQ